VALPRLAAVLAAGEARRLGGRKPLARLHGRPLAWYPVSVLHLLGAAEFIVVTRPDLAPELRGLVESVAGSGSATVVVNNEPWRENGYSLLLAAREAGPAATLWVSMSDHVYSPLLAARVAAQHPGRGYTVACDREPCCIDTGEATRVLAEPPLASRVGKGLAA
jgi:1L-myo-inositol 1-phosphate cytidylyltransferase